MVVGIQNAHFTLRERQFNAFFVKPLPNGEQDVGEQSAKAVFGVVHPEADAQVDAVVAKSQQQGGGRRVGADTFLRGGGFAQNVHRQR